MLDQLIFNLDAFLVDCQARRLSSFTLKFYQTELTLFINWLAAQQITTLPAISSHTIRLYFVHLNDSRNPGGIHAAYRAIKAWCNWLEREAVLVANPIKQVRSPKLPTAPLPGLDLDHFSKMLATCESTFTGQRDRAILCALLDTGLRRAEFLSLKLANLNTRTGAIWVNGKGNKRRVVFLGAKGRRELLKYLRLRPALSDSSPLWVSDEHQPLSFDGLRQVIRRRAARAKVPCPGLHDFRRAFALQCLRNGMDLISLMNLMGHNSPAVLQRYLALLTADLQAAHSRSSPLDNL